MQTVRYMPNHGVPQKDKDTHIKHQIRIRLGLNGPMVRTNEATLLQLSEGSPIEKRLKAIYFCTDRPTQIVRDFNTLLINY